MHLMTAMQPYSTHYEVSGTTGILIEVHLNSVEKSDEMSVHVIERLITVFSADI